VDAVGYSPRVSDQAALENPGQQAAAQVADGDAAGRHLLGKQAAPVTDGTIDDYQMIAVAVVIFDKFRTLDLGSEPNIRVYDSTALNAKGKTPNNLRT
jgi:hypothetical protein